MTHALAPRAAGGAVLALVTAFATACSSTPAERPPLAAPRVATQVRHASGSPLSGATGVQVAAVEHGDPASALQAVVTFVALEELPANLLEPLASRARVLANERSDRPLVAAPHLLEGARAGVVPDAAAFASRLERRKNRFADLRGALPRGVTGTFEATRDGTFDVAAEPCRERVSVHLHRLDAASPPARGVAAITTTLELALELETLHDGRCSRELAVVDVPPLRAGEGFCVIVRSPFSGDEARALAALALVEPAPAPGAPGEAAHRTAFATCAADLAREAILARELPARSAPAPRAATGPDLGAARRALGTDARRGALFALAHATGARLAEDIAASASDELLRTACDAIAREANAPGAPASGPALGWAVERGAIAALRDLLARETPPAQAEVLVLDRAGAAAKSLATFFAIVERATGLDDLERRLVAANLELLEDGSPAVRARACEWLAARGRVPAGYDPLDTAEHRRAALEAATSDTGNAGGGK